MGLEVSHTQLVIESFSKVQNLGKTKPLLFKRTKKIKSGPRHHSSDYSPTFIGVLWGYFFSLHNESAYEANNSSFVLHRFMITPCINSSRSLTVFRLDKKLSVFNGIWRFITMSAAEFRLQLCKSSPRPHTLCVITNFTLMYIYTSLGPPHKN